MKSYIVDRSSSTPQLNEMPTNVEKIYPTKEDAEAALANGDIADGEFVSTVDTVTDTGDKFDKSYLSYSTEETLTGGTWIDGKPIYRKNLWNDKTTRPTNFSVSDLNIDVITNWEICVSDVGDQWFQPGSVNNNVYCYYNSTNKTIVFQQSFYCANLTIEYTKTTD